MWHSQPFFIQQEKEKDRLAALRLTRHLQKLQTHVYLHEDLLAALIWICIQPAPPTNSLYANPNPKQPAAPPVGIHMFVATVYVCIRLVWSKTGHCQEERC